MTRRHFIAASAAVMGGFANAAGVRSFVSGPKATSVLELYTSEGCSSCPPADEWLSTLRAHPGLWKDVIPMAFHVDYWDYLGWKDPYGSAAHSQRQRAYATEWNARTIYTPGFVLNGREWKAQREFSLAGMPHVGVLKLDEVLKDQWEVRFESAQKKGNSLRYHLALLGFDLESKVTRGENAGRVLRHDFVVLQHIEAIAKDGAALLTLSDPRAGAIVAWVSVDDDPRPVQAVGGVL